MAEFFLNRRILIVLALLSVSACTQKRPTAFDQGQGNNLDRIEAWAPKWINLETGNTLGTAPTTNAQDRVEISTQIKAMNHFDLVEIKVADPTIQTLLGKPPFRGRPNTTGLYQVEVKLSGKYLKFYKVAKAQDLPFEETFYQEAPLPDGRLVIPMVGYKVKSYYRIEAKKTGDDQESNHLIEIEEQDPQKATHVRIDWSSRMTFDAVKQVDLFPAELFFTRDPITQQVRSDGEWYYSETITEKSITDTTTIVGDVAAKDQNSKLNPASKVAFLPRESEIRIINVARDERLSRDQIKNGADLNSEATLVLPIQWRDYRTQDDGTQPGLKGERVEDRKWSERKFFEADFLKLESVSLSRNADSGASNRLLDIEIDQNYFSFTLMNTLGNKGRKIHYSFLRADRNRAPYPAKHSFKEDRNTFGYFTSVKPFYPNWEYYTETDFNNRVYMSRMNPNLKSIVFHLSDDSSPAYEDIAKKAVEAWDRGFQEALRGSGRTIHIVYSPDRVPLGDLRYNTIHLVDSLDEGGLLGFGPSVADSETGEIIAATTNIYVNAFRSGAVNSVRSYLINRIEKRLSTSRSPTLLDETTKSDDKPMDKPMDKLMDQRCKYSEAVAASTSDLEISKYCSGPDANSLETLIARHATDDLSDTTLWTDGTQAIKACAETLTREKLLSTVIHEMGHNFGLRHNFYGSVDPLNFKEVTSLFGDKITPKSSSIMEYTAWEEDRLPEAGKYDIAAIRFGYGDLVDLANNQAVSVADDKSISDTLTAHHIKPADLKPYLFCSDEEAALGFNALCRPFDSGTTPKEIVDFYIQQYKNQKELRRYRRSEPLAASSAGIAAYTTDRIFQPLKEIYDQWRYQLRDYGRQSNRYLSGISINDYRAMLASMKADPTYGPLYDLYYDAANEVSEFFQSVAFGSNQYCVIDDAKGRQAVEFTELRDSLSDASRGDTEIKTCADAGGSSVKVVGEIGFPFNSVRFKRVKSSADVVHEAFGGNIRVVNDEVGDGNVRTAAAFMLGYRNANFHNQLEKFEPNILDEPNHFSQFVSRYLNRITQGVTFDPSTGVKGAQPFFETESPLYGSTARYLYDAVRVPNSTLTGYDLAASRDKLELLSVHAPQSSEDVSKASAKLILNGLPHFVALSSSQVLANRLIDTYNQTEYLLTLATEINNNDFLESQIQQISALLLTALPSQANLPSFKVEQFIKSSNSLAALKKQMGGLYSCIATAEPTLNQWDALYSQLRKDYQNLHSEDEMKLLLALSITDYSQKGLRQPFTTTQESLTKLPEVLRSCITAEATRVAKHRKDYGAQKSLLLNVLTTFGY